MHVAIKYTCFLLISFHHSISTLAINTLQQKKTTNHQLDQHLIDLLKHTIDNGLIAPKGKQFVADKVAHVKKPEADLGGVSIKNVTRGSANFHGELNVTNPYSHSIPFCEINYTLKSVGREVVSDSISDSGSLKANDIMRMDELMKVPYDLLISLMNYVGRDWGIDYELCVKLIIHLPVLGNFTILVTKRGEMKLPTLSDIF